MTGLAVSVLAFRNIGVASHSAATTFTGRWIDLHRLGWLNAVRWLLNFTPQ